MTQVTVASKVNPGLDKWLREYAASKKWSISQTIAELLEEKRKDIECRDLARVTGGRNDAPIGEDGAQSA